jgi:hypothetical protein
MRLAGWHGDAQECGLDRCCRDQTWVVGLSTAGGCCRAGEVRTPPQRLSAAAKEIKELIDTAPARVQSGTTLVDEARRTMDEIIGAV